MSKAHKMLVKIYLTGRVSSSGRQARLLLSALVLFIVGGCSHPLEIFGEGDIISQSGNRNCILEDFQAGDPKCSVNLVVHQYKETYTAVPRPGWVFKQWKTYCSLDGDTDTCAFAVSAERVYFAWGQTVTPLRAEFVRDCAATPGCVESLVPHLGAVSDTSIKVWQATKGDAEFELRYRNTAADSSWIITSLAIDATTGWVGVIQLEDLEPDTAYDYETWLDGTHYHTGKFSTLPSAGWTGTLRFGFASSLTHHAHPFDILGYTAARDYHFMLLIGDLLSDQSALLENTVDAYSQRYWLTWNESNFADLGSSTPLFMMWNDNEIYQEYYPGLIAPNETVSRYPAARSAYDRYSGSHNPDTNGELYYSFSVPGADFFVLDTRSHRSPNSAVDNTAKSMLGQVQRDALLDYLEHSTAPFKFIVSSVPFSIGQASTDTWSSFQTERALILSEIERRGIFGVAFLSGGRPWSGAFRFTSAGGYDYYEFVPSPAGSFVRTGAALPEGNNDYETVVFSDDTVNMFGDFQLDLTGSTPSLRAAFIDAEDEEVCAINITNTETGVYGGGDLATCQ